MGTWAEDTFGNDTTCDWIYSFLEDPGLSVVQAAIKAILDTEDYLDSDDAWNCLAACEVIARLQGKWGLQNPYSEALDNWIESHPTHISDDLKLAADRAIERILGPDSELPELWDEGGWNTAWHDAVDNLRIRIRG